MENNNSIVKGSIVKWNGGYYRVKACFTNTVNLTGPFGSKTTDKGIAKSECVEAHDEWYSKWQQSETYMCM